MDLSTEAIETLARLAHEAAYWKTYSTNNEFVEVATSVGLDMATVVELAVIATDYLLSGSEVYLAKFTEVLSSK